MQVYTTIFNPEVKTKVKNSCIYLYLGALIHIFVLW